MNTVVENAAGGRSAEQCDGGNAAGVAALGAASSVAVRGGAGGMVGAWWTGCSGTTVSGACGEPAGFAQHQLTSATARASERITRGNVLEAYPSSPPSAPVPSRRRRRRSRTAEALGLDGQEAEARAKIVRVPNANETVWVSVRVIRGLQRVPQRKRERGACTWRNRRGRRRASGWSGRRRGRKLEQGRGACGKWRKLRQQWEGRC